MTSDRRSGVLDAFGDPLNRDILMLADDAPVSAKELAARIDVTPPTVYRRTDRLVELDLLGVKRCVDDEGNHYRTFETRLEQIEVSFEDGGYAVEVTLRQSFTDAFECWWTELDGENDLGLPAAEPLDSGTRNDSSPT